MRATWTLALLTIVGFSGFAHAEKWQARGELLTDQSMTLCAANYGGRELYPPPSFEFVDNTLSLSNKYGVMLTIPVPADGVIKNGYAWSGSFFVISGNVKSREFQLATTSYQHVCRWKLIPQ